MRGGPLDGFRLRRLHKQHGRADDLATRWSSRGSIMEESIRFSVIMRPLVLLEFQFWVAPHGTLTCTAQSRASRQSRVSRCGEPLLLLVDVYHSAVSPST